jgi:putative transposase
VRSFIGRWDICRSAGWWEPDELRGSRPVLREAGGEIPSAYSPLPSGRARLYLPVGRGFLYLVAVMDWSSRAVLAWRLSNTMDVSFCVSALEEALARFGTPEIFNTDQGSQFTSAAFTGTLAAAGIRISMDGRGRWMDNVFIERLWRSLKHEDLYLKGYSDGHDAKAGISEWIAFYNHARPHQALGNRTPMAVWRDGVTGALGEKAVDMTLRLDNAHALSTSPQPPQQQRAA